MSSCRSFTATQPPAHAISERIAAQCLPAALQHFPGRSVEFANQFGLRVINTLPDGHLHRYPTRPRFSDDNATSSING